MNSFFTTEVIRLDILMTYQEQPVHSSGASTNLEDPLNNQQKVLVINFNNFDRLKQMGLHSSTPSVPATFSTEDWQEIALTPFTGIKDPSYGSNFKVYANKLNPSLELEKYDLFFNGYQEYTLYRDITQWRNNSRYIVQAKHIRQPQKQQFCSSFEQSSVFIERIPIRLVEIQDISIEEGLCILYSAVQGFDKLYEKYGFFEVEPEMVGFNKEGFVRVWLNKNLSRHYPESVFIENKLRTYEHFIEAVVTMIERLIDFEGKVTITEYIQKYSISKAYEVILAVLERYARDYQIIVPRYLSSIRNICQGPRKKRSTTQRQRFTSRQDTQRTKVDSSKKRLLQIQKRGTRLSNLQSYRPSHLPLQELQFNQKSKSFLEAPYTDRNFISMRTPTVRFHYRNSTLPNSPKATWSQNQTIVDRKTISGLTSPERIDSNQSLHCFYKKKRSVSKLQKWQIDPEIAADLARLEEIAQ